MRVQAELVAIGSELLLGQIIDTNTAFIAKRLAEIGVEVVRTATVGDSLERMEGVLRDAIRRSQIVITTGGIGPTEDDLTREAIANVTGRPLTFQPHLMEQIRALIERRGFKMAENNRVQAFIPEGSIAIENPKGTAPGFIVEGDGYCTATLPGVPSEMQFLLDATVVPYLRTRFGLTREVLRYKVLRVCGLGESAIGLQIKDLMKESKNPIVGTLAAIGDVRIRIAARADSPEEADTLIGAMENEIRRRLGILIYGVDDETLQGNTAALLARKCQPSGRRRDVHGRRHRPPVCGNRERCVFRGNRPSRRGCAAEVPGVLAGRLRGARQGACPSRRCAGRHGAIPIRRRCRPGERRGFPARGGQARAQGREPHRAGDGAGLRSEHPGPRRGASHGPRTRDDPGHRPAQEDRSWPNRSLGGTPSARDGPDRVDLTAKCRLGGGDRPEDRHLVGNPRGFLLARRADDAVAGILSGHRSYSRLYPPRNTPPNLRSFVT